MNSEKAYTEIIRDSVGHVDVVTDNPHSTAGHREGVAAFLEKRAANDTGR